MSASLETGALPYSSPELGSTSGMVAPLTESTNSPPMKLRTVVIYEFLSSQICEYESEHVEPLVEKVVADGQWRQEPQHIAKCAAGQDDDSGRVCARTQRLGQFGVGLD